MTDLSGREVGGYRLLSLLGRAAWARSIALIASEESLSDLVLHELGR